MEVCFQHELGLERGSTSFIRFGYWDSLKKGLLAGDQMMQSLKRLEVAYLVQNSREYELTKHVSLGTLAPEALIRLKQGGSPTFEIPEWLFDLDTPGHYRRRIKEVAVTIPAVTGPYSEIRVKLTLRSSSYRKNKLLLNGEYARDPAVPDDPRFVNNPAPIQAIVTSTGQNDAGLFEPGLRDERYLPFEGAGAISQWQVEWVSDVATFDRASVSDVILHLRYTAEDKGPEPTSPPGVTLRSAAIAARDAQLKSATTAPLSRLFSVRHEFPSEWRRFQSAGTTPATLTIDLTKARFPYFAQPFAIAIRRAVVTAPTSVGDLAEVGIGPGAQAPNPAATEWTGEDGPGGWTLATNADPRSLTDLFVVVSYGLS